MAGCLKMRFYITFYKNINEEVFIARVMYQKRDYIRVLFDGY